MKLTTEEIESIAEYLDDLIGNNFHDAIMNTISERVDDAEDEVSDEDIQKIKNKLKLFL
tara:strand:+ start:1255 stop:1431 length:177 start_codon:yes stop_codon:yes gene_type:complete